MNLLFDLLSPIYDYLVAFHKQERLPKILNLPTHGRLIDVGGGTGRVIESLQDQVSHAIVLDLSQSMLRKARHHKKLCALQSKAEKIPFPDNTFERILVVDAFHHFQEQEQVVPELYRILKPGGRLVIEDPDVHYTIIKIIWVIERLLLTKSRFFKPEMIVSMFEALGAKCRIEKAKHFSKWVIIDKPNYSS